MCEKLATVAAILGIVYIPRIISGPNDEINLFCPFLFEPVESMVDQTKWGVAVTAKHTMVDTAVLI